MWNCHVIDFFVNPNMSPHTIFSRCYSIRLQIYCSIVKVVDRSAE